MILKHWVLDQLENNDVVKEFCSQGKHIGNLYEMEEALTLAAAFHKDKKTRLIVKKNRYAAQQLYKRLAPLVDDVLLFVMEESLRVQAIASSPEDEQEFLYTLNQCIDHKEPKIIICNVAAYLRYLPDVDFFRSCQFPITVNQEVDRKQLIEHLNRAGYVKVNYVDRPCTFAYRGEIIDIFTLEYEHPIRIEFFDTEVESIRFFHVDTQRTIEKIDQVTIRPASDLLFTNQQIQEIQEKVQIELEKEKKRCTEDEFEILQDQIEQDLRGLENYSNEARLYWYYTFVKSSRITEYIDGIVVISSQEEVEESVKNLLNDNISFLQEMVQDHRWISKYTMFHDYYNMGDQRQYIHEFLDFENPIISEIYPIEKGQQSALEQIQKISTPHVLFSVDKNERKKIEALLEDHPISQKVDWIEPIFYEGFQYQEFSVYTTRELFPNRVTHKKYQKTFKEGQILENVLELEHNDYVVHEQYGIGQYVGIVTREKNGKKLDYLHIIYRNEDELFVPLSQFQLVRKYISKEGVGIKLSQLGSNQWQKTKEKVNAKVEEIAGRLVELYSSRNEHIGYAYAPDDALQKEFEDAFPYQSTPDQIQATEEIKREMEKDKPMDHLLCGDVGFGKTEVAMRVAFKAISNNKQVAFLCPTTILSIQHYQTLTKRFESVGANIALVNRFVSPAEIKEIQKRLKEGNIDIIVGTHRLFNPSFQYKDLGLLIIDEEQRFGVEHKEKIKEMKNSIDVLSLSATPIPRTMQMSLIGVRTISQLNTPPAQRHPVQTYVMEKKGTVIKDIIQRELSRDGQVFYLYNRISNIYAVANQIQNDFPDIKVAVAHGRMSKEEIEDTMMEFAQGKYQILVCTTIIETGLDIANANTMIIEDADRFGLSQLYQIRGRVGRRERIAYCYLMIQPQKQLTEQAHKRLKSIKEFTKLGSGYKIAMRDLTIRGAGDLLGPQQAGFIDSVGLDLYLELLSKAIARKKGEVVQEKPKEKVAQLQVDGYIPETFSTNDGNKLSLYQDIRNIKTMDDLTKYEDRIRDLYGRIPKQVKQLFVQRKLDMFANQPGVDTIQENNTSMQIIMDTAWSSHCNGVKLFETMNDLSPKIGLTLKKGKIEITIPKKGKYMDLMMKAIHQILHNKDIYAS